MKTDEPEVPFEQRIGRLEGIVKQLERGDLSLEESLLLFEEGTFLARALNTTLDAAEKKIEILVRNQRGEYQAEPFEPGEA